MDRETLVEGLHKGTCQVVFEKVDGEKRTMNCTLNPNIANMPQPLQEQSNRSKNPNVIAVWDLDANDWRSFRVDSVESFIPNSRTLTEG